MTKYFNLKSVIFFIGFIYITLIFSILPSNHFFVPDSGLKFIKTEQLVDKGIKRFTDITIDYPGRKIDPELKFQPFPMTGIVKNDKLFSQYSPTIPVLTSFFYDAFGFKGLYIIPVFSGLLSLIIMYFLSKKVLDKKFSLISVVILGLCTPLFFYSLVFWEHAPGLLFSMLILYMVVKFVIDKNVWLLIIIPFLGMINVALVSDSALFILCLTISLFCLYFPYIKENKKKFFIVLTVITFFIFTFIIFNLISSGTLFGLHIERHIFQPWVFKSMLDPYYRASIIAKIYFKTTSSVSLNHYLGIYMIPVYAFLIFFICIFAFKDNHPQVITSTFGAAFKKTDTMICVSIALIIGLAISNSMCHGYIVGLFQVTPFVIFALFFVVKQKRKTDSLKFIKIFALVYFICSFFTPQAGEMQWGPRHMLAFYPILILLSLNSLEMIKNFNSFKNSSKFLTISFVILIGLSFLIQIKGVRYLYKVKSAKMKHYEILENEPTGLIVVCDDSCPSIINCSDRHSYFQYKFYVETKVPTLYNKKIFFHTTHNNIEELLNKFIINNVTRFSMVGQFPDISDGNIELLFNKLLYHVRDYYLGSKENVVMKTFEMK